jgi:hypothetical protein
MRLCLAQNTDLVCRTGGLFFARMKEGVPCARARSLHGGAALGACSGRSGIGRLRQQQQRPNILGDGHDRRPCRIARSRLWLERRKRRFSFRHRYWHGGGSWRQRVGAGWLGLGHLSSAFLLFVQSHFLFLFLFFVAVHGLGPPPVRQQRRQGKCARGARPHLVGKDRVAAFAFADGRVDQVQCRRYLHGQLAVGHTQRRWQRQRWLGARRLCSIPHPGPVSINAHAMYSV